LFNEVFFFEIFTEHNDLLEAKSKGFNKKKHLSAVLKDAFDSKKSG